VTSKPIRIQSFFNSHIPKRTVALNQLADARQASDTAKKGGDNMSDPNVGAQWNEGGMRYTVNPTSDPAAGPDGFYLSMLDLETGAKATAVYDGDYNLIKFPGRP
jgi:hypothetical protein